jgi:hypothetical protein
MLLYLGLTMPYGTGGEMVRDGTDGNRSVAFLQGITSNWCSTGMNMMRWLCYSLLGSA